MKYFKTTTLRDEEFEEISQDASYDDGMAAHETNTHRSPDLPPRPHDERESFSRPGRAPDEPPVDYPTDADYTPSNKVNLRKSAPNIWQYNEPTTNMNGHAPLVPRSRSYYR